jgi:hypothetical protein
MLEDDNLIGSGMVSGYPETVNRAAGRHECGECSSVMRSIVPAAVETTIHGSLPDKNRLSAVRT